MSLSAGERQSLGAIENGLAEAYPSLAEKLTTFTRLAADQDMPGHERVSPRPPHVMTPSTVGTGRITRPGGCCYGLPRP